MRSGYCPAARVRNDSPFLAEIDADGVGVGPILENRRWREGRCVAHGREGELIEPRIAARLADAYEAERASKSNGEYYRRAPALAGIRLLPGKRRPDLRKRDRRLVGWSKP